MLEIEFDIFVGVFRGRVNWLNSSEANPWESDFVKMIGELLWGESGKADPFSRTSGERIRRVEDESVRELVEKFLVFL